MKYKDHVINYAIDNKVSLEEAYTHFIIKGRDEKEKKWKEKWKEEVMTEEATKHIKPEPVDSPSEYFEDENYTEPLFEQESALSPEEEEAWQMYDKMKDDLERLYNEYTEAPLTKEDMLWVELQLKMIAQIEKEDE